MPRAPILILAVSALTALGALRAAAGPAPPSEGYGQGPPTYRLGDTLDERLALPDVTGRRHRLADYRGRPVVLEFWSLDCAWAQRKEARRRALVESYGQAGVVYLAVAANVDELDREGAQPYERLARHVEKEAPPYPILIDRDAWLAERLDARTTPHAYVIDPDGVLVYDGAFDDSGKTDAEVELNYVAKALDAVLARREVALKAVTPWGCTLRRPTSD